MQQYFQTEKIRKFHVFTLHYYLCAPNLISYFYSHYLCIYLDCEIVIKKIIATLYICICSPLAECSNAKRNIAREAETDGI